MSRVKIPADWNGVCASCGTRRGSKTGGWHRVLRNDRLAAWICPDCPTEAEPIKRLVVASGVRFRCTTISSPRGAEVKQATGTFATLAEARAWLAKVRAARGDGGAFVRDREQETVAALAQRWLDSMSVDMRPVTKSGYVNASKAVIRHFQDRRVVSIRKSDVKRFINWLRTEGKVSGKPYSVGSARYALLALGQMMQLAVEDGLIIANPVKQLEKNERPKDTTAKPETPRWTVDELAAFITEADKDELAAVLRLSACGMTRADIAGLQWRDIDLDRGVLHIARGAVWVQGKGIDVREPKSRNRKRVVAFETMQPGTAEKLRALKVRRAAEQLATGPAYSNPEGFVVVDGLGQQPNPERYSERFRTVARRAGLPAYRLHALRHTLADAFTRGGIPDVIGAGVLGHDVKVYQSSYAGAAKDRELVSFAPDMGKALRGAS
jgi:integrase